MSVEVDEAGLADAGITYLGLKLEDAESQQIGHTFEVDIVLVISYFITCMSKFSD